jgi:hypothetical protein
MAMRTISMFEDQRLTLEESIDLTRQSLLAYGLEYRHWAIARAVVEALAHLSDERQAA